MAHNIGEYQFEFWDGPPPALPTRKLTVSHRPGVSGVAHQVLGTWGETFSAVLTSHHPTWEFAAERYSLLRALIGAGPQFVIYEGWLWSGFHGTFYNVEAIELIEIRSAIILIGPNYSIAGTAVASYPSGASLVTRFTMTPQAI